MREILFCGKRKDNGEWVYGYYFCLHHNDGRKPLHHFIIPIDIKIPKYKPIGEIQVEVIPETVGQYTGLTDKNGTKIFEGDIILNVRRGYNALISYDNTQAGFIVSFNDRAFPLGNIDEEVKVIQTQTGRGAK